MNKLGFYSAAKVHNGLSPPKATLEAYRKFNSGNYVLGTFNAAAGILGFTELRNWGALGRTMSFERIWKAGTLFRGNWMKYKLAGSIYSGLEHLAEAVSPFFKVIDFYDPAKSIGISLKTVNAGQILNLKIFCTMIT